MTRLLETTRIAPPPATPEERLLPLTFFDVNWLHFHPIRRLLFFDLPFSREHVLETLLPKLKQSLSITLAHYFPLASTLAYPSDTQKNPLFRYAPGDSVSLTIVDSDGDFDTLVGNHARDADQFYDFVPQLPPPSEEPDWQLLQMLGVQVTIFPGRGMCIGLANHHAVGDGTSIVGFIKCWADLCKQGGDVVKSLPVFDRSLVKEPPGAHSHLWNFNKRIPIKSSPFPLPTNRVRATFVLGQPEIKKFKNLLMARKPGLLHISSFVVTTAYIWTCLAKSIVAAEDIEVDKDAETFFLLSIDARTRLDPPVPENYFGNCLVPGLVKTRRGDLIGEEGFFRAAEVISMEIQNRANDKEKVMAGWENWGAEIGAAVKKGIMAVSGSARVDLYNVDFGWGKVRKVETLSIDGEKYAMSLCKSRELEGGLEVGMSLPKVVMDAFGAVFADGLIRG